MGFARTILSFEHCFDLDTNFGSQRNSIAVLKIPQSDSGSKSKSSHLAEVWVRQTEGMQELILPGVSPRPWETEVSVKDAHGSRPGVLGEPPGWEARHPSLCLPPPHRPWLFTVWMLHGPSGLAASKVTMFKWPSCLHLTSSRAKLLSVWDPPIPSQQLSWRKKLLLTEHL